MVSSILKQICRRVFKWPDRYLLSTTVSSGKLGNLFIHFATCCNHFFNI
uniref:Uncharacterized protein n=1 Tax=Lepeophtheirus salmonis TaxID=72036 RepID=A0A0K2ULJ8_LEPSM